MRVSTFQFSCSLYMVALSALTGCKPAPLSDTQAKANLVSQAKDMVAALDSGQSDKLLDFMYPPALEKSGGREAAKRSIEDSKAQMKSDGIALKSTTVGDPVQMVQGNGKSYAIIPQTGVMTVPHGTLESKSYLLAVSEDGGRNWKFVDVAPGAAAIRSALPEIPPELNIPARSPATFTPA